MEQNITDTALHQIRVHSLQILVILHYSPKATIVKPKSVDDKDGIAGKLGFDPRVVQ